MIAQTPPMGWNSWDCYGAAVDEPTVRQNAAYMAEHLQVFGWEYVVVFRRQYQYVAVHLFKRQSRLRNCSIDVKYVPRQTVRPVTF